MSAPPKLTSLGGRRVSADFMLLPGNDQFMKAFSPMKAKDAKVPTVFKQHSAPGLLRTKSLSALIDAEHPARPDGTLAVVVACACGTCHVRVKKKNMSDPSAHQQQLHVASRLYLARNFKSFVL